MGEMFLSVCGVKELQLPGKSNTACGFRGFMAGEIMASAMRKTYII
jgi:hypothetical protein